LRWPNRRVEHDLFYPGGCFCPGGWYYTANLVLRDMALELRVWVWPNCRWAVQVYWRIAPVYLGLPAPWDRFANVRPRNSGKPWWLRQSHRLPSANNNGSFRAGFAVCAYAGWVCALAGWWVDRMMPLLRSVAVVFAGVCRVDPLWSVFAVLRRVCAAQPWEAAASAGTSMRPVPRALLVRWASQLLVVASKGRSSPRGRLRPVDRCSSAQRSCRAAAALWQAEFPRPPPPLSPRGQKAYLSAVSSARALSLEGTLMGAGPRLRAWSQNRPARYSGHSRGDP